LPVVASRVVPYSLTVRHGQDGLLVDNDEASWFGALEELALQPDLRARLGAAARLRAEAEFMLTSCIFDELPWAEWGAAGKPLPASQNGAQRQQQRELELAAGAWAV
jgi:hypothetical protein